MDQDVDTVDCATSELDAVLRAFRSLPTDQLVAETLLITNDSHSGPRLSGAATFGFTRARQYLDTARGLIEQIVTNADQISWHMNAYFVIRDGIGQDYERSPIAMQEVSKAASHELGAKILSLHSEVHWHLYAECLDRAWYFMRNSTTYVAPMFTLNAAQHDYIVTIREFRNHMAHRDKAVLDIESPDWHSMSRGRDGYFEVGYKRDKRNRVIFSPVSGDLKGRTLKMPISYEGFQQFKNIMVDTYTILQQRCLERLYRQFTDHPETMPTLEHVGTLVRDSIEPAEG